MAKLHFFYSTMNAGKSTALLQTNHNFIENNLETLVFIPKVSENSHAEVSSRIGIKIGAIEADNTFNFFDYVESKRTSNIKSIFIDEAQFLKTNQIEQLAKIADKLNIPVLCYGLRTNFLGEFFEGSSRLLAIADNLHEIKTICSMCTKKATMVVRVDADGNIQTDGKVVELGGNELYKSVCRKHFRRLTKIF
jgi:thymidine kinase